MLRLLAWYTDGESACGLILVVCCRHDESMEGLQVSRVCSINENVQMFRSEFKVRKMEMLQLHSCEGTLIYFNMASSAEHSSISPTTTIAMAEQTPQG